MLIHKEPYKILIWGAGRAYNRHIDTIKRFECQGDVVIVGITSDDRYANKIDGIPFVKKLDLVYYNIDIVVLMLENIESNTFIEDIHALFRNNVVVVGCQILDIYGFTFQKYYELAKSNLSIMASTCWGGVTYHHFGLPFLSPLINLNMTNADFFKLMKEPKRYLNGTFELIGNGYNNVEKYLYPVCALEDITINFVHYRDMDEAVSKWKERLERVNWDNIFITIYTENKSDAEEFDALPYLKKFCFVSFKTDIKSCFSIDVDKYHEGQQRRILSDMYFDAVTGRYQLFDVWNLLLYGEISKRCEMA